MKRYRDLLAWSVLAVLVAPLAALALAVCGTCGHEASGHSCGHCGAVLAAAEQPEPEAEPPASTQVATASVWDQVIDADVASATQLYRSGKPELAYHFCRNALALNYLIADEAARSARAARLTKMRDACVVDGRLVARPCPVCEGTGRGVFEPKSLTSDTTLSVRAAGVCKRCGGKGQVQGRPTVDETKFSRAQTLSAYRQMRVARTHVAVGECWVPQGMDTGLSVQERVALKSAIPLRCEACLGVGREDCSACNGRGLEECRARGCERGEVRETRQGLALEDRVIVSVCGACNGSGEASCTRCMGAGSLLCRGCSGSGEAKLCTRCDGRGLSSCRKCGSSGSYRGERCTYCQGSGVSECSSCNGSGRRR